jgi:hypothetical protein
VVPTDCDEIVVAVRSEGEASVWDVAERAEVARLQTVYDVGATSLAYSGRHSRCIAAAYHVHGVCCYDTSGQLMWQRKDLKRNQGLTISPDGSRVLFFNDEGPCHVLSVTDGQTLEQLRGVRDLWFSKDGSLELRQTTNADVVDAQGELVFRLPRDCLTLGPIVTGAFSGKLLAVAAGGPQCIYDLASREEVMRYQPTGDTHVIKAAALGDETRFVAVTYSVNALAPDALLHISPADGSVEVVTEFERRFAMAFCMKGSRLLLSTGDLLDTATGAVIARFDLGAEGIGV